MSTAKAVAEVPKRKLSGLIGFKLLAEGLGRVAQFGTLALAARSLSLADFGRYGLALVIGFLLAQLADFGLHLGVTRSLSREVEVEWIGRATATKLGLLVGLTALAGIIALVWGEGQTGPFAGLIVSALLYSLADFAFAVLRAQSRLYHEAWLVILHRTILLTGAGLTFLIGAGLGGLALAHLAAGSLVAFIAWRLARLRLVGSFDPALLRRVAPIGLAIFLSLLAFKVDVPLLQALTGNSTEVGLYNAAYRLFEPVLLFPAALMSGLFPSLARAGQRRLDPSFRRQVGRLLAGLLAAGLVIGVGLALVAPWLVTFLFGSAYGVAGPTLQLLALAVPCLFVNSGLTYLFLALDRERYNLYFFGGAVFLNIGANLVLIPLWGRNGAAVATGLTELGLTLACSLTLLVVLRPTPPTAPTEVQVKPVLISRAIGLNRLGFGGLLALVICLPFELNQQPWLNLGGWLTLNNLKLVYYGVIGLALFTLWVNRAVLRQRRWQWHSPGLWLLIFLILCLISTAFSTVPKESLKFTFDLTLAGLLWLTVPFWLRENRLSRLVWLRVGLVGSAAFSAGLGLLEFVPDLAINRWLLWPFKAGATIAGPFLRLSGTFEYANIAAMYYELALPFALVGLVEAVGQARLARNWQSGAALVGWLIAVGLLWEGLLLTFSRAALPGMLVAGPVIVWAGRRQWRKWWPGFGLVAGLGWGLLGLSVLFSPTLVLRFKTQSDQGWYQASYSSDLAGSVVACDQPRPLVTVHNLTPLDWMGGPDGLYRLSYHWLDQPNHVYQFEGLRSDLPPVLKAGQTAQVTARLNVPARPGRYWLVWDIVQGETNWFSLKSAAYNSQPVEVRPTAGASCAERGPVTGLAPPDRLPTAPPNPERNRLWAVAARMIAARPWTGVGPDGYRFNYGSYAGLTSWDERIFANSTPLELAADLGLPGTASFLVLIIVCIWPLIGRAWRGGLSLTRAAILAALIAFGLHGLLDYFLGFHAVFILFWLLLALAWLDNAESARRDLV